MPKFHVNPATGVPGECTATRGSCPFGGEATHGETIADAIQRFEKAFVAVPQSQSKVDVAAAKDAIDDYRNALMRRASRLRELRDARKNGSNEATRKALQAAYSATHTEADEALAIVENAGMGHMVPDDGPTIRVASKEQKILLQEELLGQISDGHWENTYPNDHWEVWTRAEVIVDPNNVGRNFHAEKDNYQLNSSELLSIVGDRMVESVQQGTSNGSYDSTRMGHDLRDLRKIFKTPRKNHEASEENPVQPQASSASAGPTDWTVSIKGAGSKNSLTTYSGTNIGYSDHTDHSGSTVVVATQADGKRARMMVIPGDAFSDPEKMMGQPFTHFKRTKTGGGSTPGLHIVGVQNSTGAVTGWMPNKRTQTFTLDGV